MSQILSQDGAGCGYWVKSHSSVFQPTFAKRRHELAVSALLDDLLVDQESLGKCDYRRGGRKTGGYMDVVKLACGVLTLPRHPPCQATMVYADLS